MKKSAPRVLAGCFLAYFCAYLCRLNLAAALPAMTREMELSAAGAGMFQTVFAAVYALGQVVNGLLVDKVSPRRHIVTGLCASALCNAAIGLNLGYIPALILWGLSAAAQSMLWTPIVRLVAGWYGQEERSKATFTLSFSLIFGHLAAWALSGLLAEHASWRYSFLIPAILAVLCAPLCYKLIQNPLSERGRAQERKSAMPLKDYLLRTGLIPLLLACALNGFVRDGATAWTPTILSSLTGGGILLSLTLPACNVLGLLGAKTCLALTKNDSCRATEIITLLGMLLALLLAALSASPALTALLLGLLCAAMQGVNPLITSLIPMEYERAGRVGLTAGLVDASIYVGSAAAGVGGGALSDALGWGKVYLIFAAACLLGALLIYAKGRVRA